MTSPRRVPWLRLVLLALVSRSTLTAAVIVNAPVTLTHRVVIQPVLVRKTSGATVPGLGNAASDAYIKEQINRIWAQAGIRIDWLPFVEYVNDFAYDGSPANYTTTSRPQNHLNMIVDNAPSPPKSTDARVVNMFFVEICPAFNHLDDNYANGLAFVDANGVTVHIGRDLVGDTGGQDIIAGVVAHEIGHNLGRNHVTSADNLMSASSGTSERLTAAQRATVFTDDAGSDGYDLLQPLASNYSRWVTANGVTLGPSGDDDRDGISNVLEFMFNLNPKAPSSLPPPVASEAGLTWTVTKRPEALADGLIYQIQTGPNLQSWLTPGTAGSGSTILQDNSTTLSVRLNTGAAARGFMRMNVTIPAGL